MIKIFYCCLLLFSCNSGNIKKRCVEFDLDQNVKIPARDTIVDSGTQLLLNEYYKFTIGNNKYDTLFLPISQFKQDDSKYKKFFSPSRIVWVDKNSNFKSDEFISTSGTHNLNINKGEKHEVWLLMENYSDTLFKKSYIFNFTADSSGHLINKIFKLESGMKNASFFCDF